MTKTVNLIGINVLMFLILAIIALAGGEIYLRTYHKINAQSDAAVGIEIFREGTANAYEHLPSSKHIKQYGNQEITFQINDLGFRDLKEKSEIGDKNMLILGDSFIFGSLMQYENTFPYLLQEELGNDWSVHDGGVVGYTLDNEYLLLKEKFDLIKPNLIIVGVFVANDVTEFRRHQWSKDFLGDLIKVTDTEIYVDSDKTLRNYKIREPASYVINWLQEKFEIIALKFGATYAKNGDYTLTWPVFLKEDHPGYDPRVPQFYNQLFEMMQAINSFTTKNDVKTVFVIIPMDVQVSKIYWDKYSYIPSLFDEETFEAKRPQKVLNDFCSENNFFCLDLLPEFEKSPEKDTLYFRNNDPHFDKAGHLLTTELIYKYLKENNLYE